MPNALRALALSLGLFSFSSVAAQAVVIPTVPVGNPVNAAPGSDIVPYEYRIGTTEVTNAQYVEFLNAKAASDPLELYDPNMTSGANETGGIVRSGADGSYSYAAKPDMGNKPVNYVSWYDAVRFINWLNNGQGNGDTETGAYTLLGGTPTPSNGMSVTRNAVATWFLPNSEEWFKAAYYQPAEEGGDADSYWLYPTASNSLPTQADADAMRNISNPGANVANYSSGVEWNGYHGSVTTVGSAGPLSTSYYGTYDQGGNVAEWTEQATSQTRILRGGSWFDGEFMLRPTNFTVASPMVQISRNGFRVATVPEPGTCALAASGVIGLLAFRQRRK